VRFVGLRVVCSGSDSAPCERYRISVVVLSLVNGRNRGGGGELLFEERQLRNQRTSE
jgi:hypothetical protein